MRTVKVAVFPFPPAIFVDEADGTVKGFYVDMLQEVASRERWELQFVPGTWAEGIERARKGDVDLLTSVAFTPERATFLDFGKEPSFTVWSLLYAHPKVDIQSILDLKDRSVAVMRNDANGANFRKLSTQFGIPITFLELGTFVDVMKAVESRQVDAGVTANSFGYFSEPNYRVVRTPVVVNPFPIFFAVGKNKNADLLPALDRFLAEGRVNSRSRHAQIVDRWLNRSNGSLSPWVMRGFFLGLALLGLSLGAVMVFRRKVRRATHEIRSLNHDLRSELEARLASEKNLTITLHSIGDAVIATDAEGLITRMNATAERLTGWPLAEAMGRPLTEVFRIASALTREPSEDPVKKVLASGEVVGLANHTVLLARDGQEYQIADSAAPIRDAAGLIGGVVLVFSDVTEKYRVEAALARTTDLLKSATEIAKIGAWELTLATMELTWSPSTYRLHELDPRTPVDVASGIHFYAPEVQPVIAAAVQAAIGTGTPYDLELPLVTAKGRAFWARAQCNPVTENGKVIKLVGAFQDITERKQAELERDRSHSLLTNLTDLVPGVVYQYRLYPDGRSAFPYSSVGMNDIYEVSPEEVRLDATPVFGRLHPDDYDSVAEAIKNSAITLEEFYSEFRVILPRQGLRWRWSQAHPQRMEDGSTLWHGIILDITERKQAEAALLEANALTDAVVEHVPLMIFLKEATDLKFVLFNRAGEDLLGYDRKDLLGKSNLDLFPPEQAAHFMAMDRKVLEGGAGVLDIPEEPISTAKKGQRVLHTRKVCLMAADGTTKYLLGIAEDITERKAAEQKSLELQAQLQQSQKMESLGTLAGGVAHDMNNVLGAILGLASAHIGSQPYGSPLHRALDTICKATERGGKMVKSLLSFARQSPAENNKLDLNEILREQVALLERTTLAKVRLEIDLEANLRPILGDASALTHAFMNLCVNAVDAMPEKGRLTLHTRNVDNDWIEVVVEDNGMGMPKEVLEKAMDPFFTTKETGKGTGLGLSMVFSTVKAHRGQMSIESQPGQGTRVMLRFPACEKETQAQAAAPAVSEETAPPHGSLKVLLVDDDDLIQSSVQAILEALGHTAVNTAPSGEKALAMLEGGLESDLVILDMNMPGLGGMGTLPRLRLLRPEVPVLLATGRVDQTALTLASTHSGVTLLTKPFGLRELQKHLENIGLR